MNRLPGLIVLLALPAFAVPAQAQFFHKKVRPLPAQRVPELILVLKTETDERKRAQAAEELREFDARTFSEIVPVLIDVLHTDKKAAVRAEALNSLARLRPVSQPAGQAIEHAASADESLRVRLQAKSALLKYHIAGYSSSNRNEPSVFQPTMQEPPLADPHGATTIPAVGAAGSSKVTPAASGVLTTGDLPRPLPAGVALPPGTVVPLPPTIQIEGPVPPPRPF
jgi:HEAT repeats